MNEKTRAYIYRVVTAIMPLVVAYGLLEEDKTPLIVAAVGAILGNGLAAINTSTKP
jgi:hypothetical protein